ncbi:exonuclease SbcCD subunit D C-terminal domain-containing protein [Pseudomonas aeruginosa]|jgi:exonuclease SbcD|uniref:exonuclease SbcCD subunit D C-terminal domain-containing protein n=1 Tax=Pseudomonadaceae TaxID=135621 RepID=UPI00035E9CBD|nr:MULTISPECIES: exonuclease SbcCD subunit D C-terminal domain-containing protein [Pseudomonadaceae]EKY4116369.1 exonuclease SbcCD subunit D C-terminal domain-containing protein [Pseudomonas aeruginosa]ELB6503743.1 exonuclease SbcCD subunit D C-terminal domain-containing protein [Pseudomonas aeruginosa]ELC0932540.1 exonuclease SbcCD subunit D C-terminal domain-containing protein [Pseudomonas aeruginosa]ELM3798413.1 exonuclease SbcCD subunit D C-terminal domain-containing protein [Pseudomonas ae
MRVLHTSDWHIGRTLYGRKRYEEFEAFLTWLAETIQQNEIDALLVAGDVFDTSAPSNRAQELYYRFLCRVAASSCRHVVVVAGNHDSPSFLNAPKELLKALDVHVVGSSTESLEDEVLVLRNEQDAPELIVCAVPYLRDRDIRVAEAGESVEDKERKLIDGIRTHYAAVAALAEQKREELGVDIPIVGTGHLFTAGGQTVDGDGVRELYVGTLAHVTAGIFPANFDYLALGHLHVPQKVNGSETIRYSGSPLPMGFGEAKQQKSVCQVEFHSTSASVQLVDVPMFQKLERVKGDWDGISSRILELSATDSQGWLEVIYDGIEVIGDLRERLEEAISGTQMEILRIKNTRIIDRVLGQIHEEETLDDLNVNDVFERCLAVHEVPEDQRPELLRAYQETVSSLYEDDVQAE